MPFEVNYTMQVCLLTTFKTHWPFRSDKYWRKALREYVVAMRYLRSN
jgi:hypothetical protein